MIRQLTRYRKAAKLLKIICPKVTVIGYFQLNVLKSHLRAFDSVTAHVNHKPTTRTTLIWECCCFTGGSALPTNDCESLSGDTLLVIVFSQRGGLSTSKAQNDVIHAQK